jgi:hypothetical protein
MLKYVFISVYPNFEFDLKKPIDRSPTLQNKINLCLKQVAALKLEDNERVPFKLKDHYKLLLIR